MRALCPGGRQHAVRDGSPVKGESGKHLSVTLGPLPGRGPAGALPEGPAGTQSAMVPPVKGESGKRLSVTVDPLPGARGPRRI